MFAQSSYAKKGFIRVKEFLNSFTNYLFVLKNAQNGGNYEKT